jgi:uncharacterized membrane protein YjjP (DUF1212 family)
MVIGQQKYDPGIFLKRLRKIAKKNPSGRDLLAVLLIAGFLIILIFDPGDGDNTLLRNVDGLLLYYIRSFSSQMNLLFCAH